MAEIWPRLRKKLLACDVRRRRGKKSHGGSREKDSKAIRGSSGLERCVALLRGVQSRKTASSLVERTGASVSAARSLSRSAQEWTASTLARTASRRADARPVEGSKSPEIVLLHCAVRPSDAQTKLADFAEISFACVEVEEKLPQLESGSIIVRGEVDHLSEDSRPLGQGENFNSSTDEVSPDPAATLSVGALRRVKRTGRHVKQTSNSAFVMLVALGHFMFSHFSKVGNPLAAVLAFNAAAGAWRRGTVYARLTFSSVAVYFFSTLRSCLTSSCPKRLSLQLPRKLKAPIADAKPFLSATGVPGSLEIEVTLERAGSGLEFDPVPPVQSAAITSQFGGGAPALSLTLLAIPESAETRESPAIEPGVAPGVSVKEDGRLSPSRRLAKKLSSRLKKLKMMRSSSSSSSSSSSLMSAGNSESGSLSSLRFSGIQSHGASEPGSPTSPSLHPSAALSPDRHRKSPFCRRLHKPKPESASSELAKVHGDVEGAAHATEKLKLISGKKSRLCKMLSTEGKDVGELNNTLSITSPPPVTLKETTNPSRTVSWPMVALLVTLLFLLVGRLPAIMATTLFLVVVSNVTYDDRSHSRSRGREVSEAARKLHRSPPPRRHSGSPPRRYT